MLKKLQHDKSQELVDLDIKEDFPDKIRSLLEEVRWAKDKNLDLTDKVETEEKQMRRTREHQRNL
jgi:hypothetical protein